MSERTEILGPRGIPFRGKPGPGRPVGSKSQTTLMALEAARVARDNPGVMPVDFCLEIMRDSSNDLELRLKAAAIAGKWLHPTLQAIKIDNVTEPQEAFSPEELRGQLVKILIESGAIRADLLKPGIAQGISPGPLLEGVKVNATDND